MELIKLDKPLYHRIPFLGGSITRTLLLKSEKAKEFQEGKSTNTDYKTYLETIKEVKFEDLSRKLKGVLILWVGFLTLVGITVLFFALLIAYLVLIALFQPIIPPEYIVRIPDFEKISELLPSFMQIFTIEDLISAIEENIQTTDFISDFIIGLQIFLTFMLILIFLGYCFAFTIIPFKIIYANLTSVCLTESEEVILGWLRDPSLPQKLNPQKQKDFRGWFFRFNHYHLGMDVEHFYLAVVDTYYFFSIILSILSVFFVWTAFGLFLKNEVTNGFINLILAFLFGAIVLILLWRAFGSYRSLKKQTSTHVKTKLIEVTNKLFFSQSTNEDDFNSISIRLKVLYFQSLKKELENLPMIPVSRYLKLYGYLTVFIPLITIII